MTTYDRYLEFENFEFTTPNETITTGYGDEDSFFRHPVTDELITSFSRTALQHFGDYSLMLCEHPYGYNNIILTTNSIFIGDIDTEEVDIQAIKAEFPNLRFRFYKTFKGYRFFVTNLKILFTRSNYELIQKLFTKTNCDINYANQCWYHYQYAARLTPKPRFEIKVAELVYSDDELFSKEMPLDIAIILSIHDSFCCSYEWPKTFYPYLFEENKAP